MTLYNNKTLRISSHIIFWVCYLLIFVILTKLNRPNDAFLKIAFTTAIYSLPIDILASYFTIYVLMPKFLYPGKYIKFGISFIIAAIIFILLLRTIDYYYYVPTYHPTYAYIKSFWSFPYFNYLVSTYAIVILFVAIKLGKRWLESQSLRKELEKQNLKSELSMLKYQIGPHFLFNTLNNIDSLIYKDKDKASQTIINLSEIMRYMLYDSQQKEVSLSKEIDYIQNLIDLQSLRTTKDQFIEFNIEGSPNNKKIAPLLFVPFIENAMKHGNKTVSPPGIIINMNITSQNVHFNIVNYIDNKKQKDIDGGIGLQNVKRRLKLIYPDNYILEINENDATFEVELQIPLF